MMPVAKRHYLYHCRHLGNLSFFPLGGGESTTDHLDKIYMLSTGLQILSRELEILKVQCMSAQSKAHNILNRIVISSFKLCFN